MTHVDTIITFFKAMQTSDWHKIREITDEEFLYFGPMPDPFNRDIWLEFQEAVMKAFPDWTYDMQKVEELDDGRVKVTVSITGTHKEDLELPLHSVPNLPATGTSITLPEEHATFSFHGEKISEMRVEQTPHGGVVGLLEQLRVE